MATHEPMPLRVYAPALAARENASEIAATRSVALYGVTTPDALEAPGELSFGDFIRRSDVLDFWGAPESSDASQLLLKFRQAFPGSATRRQLAQFVRAHHSGKPRGFRYWDRLAGSLWKTYQGFVRGKERTGKAHAGEVKRLATAEARAGREAQRCALRRVPSNESEKRALPAAKLRVRARWLIQRATRKVAEAEALVQTAANLRAEACALEAEALQMEAETPNRSTVH
jgi:hypothetical protein